MTSNVRALSISAGLVAMLCLGPLNPDTGHAEQPPPPCHPNPNEATDVSTVAIRADVASLPMPLKNRLLQLASRPHTYLPQQAFAEATTSSLLFQYYLLDTHGFEPNVFTSVIPGVNDTAMKTATGSNCGLPALAAVRLVVEPKPGLPTDPADVRAFIDVFTDISGLFVINNESGWYEGWMIHDLVVPAVAPPRPDGHALYALPFTGGFPGKLGAALEAFAHGDIGALQSIVPGSGPAVKENKANVYGDDPNRPRDPDLFEADDDAQREFRQRFIPSGLAREILLDVYARPASFRPDRKNLKERLFKAYAAEVARVDQNGDGVISALEGDVDTGT